MKKTYFWLMLLSAGLMLSACQMTKKSENKSSGQQPDSSVLAMKTDSVVDSASTSSVTEGSVAPEQTGLMIEEILSGNYSSIEGTWVREDGQTFTFNAEGLVADDYKIFNVRQTGDYLTFGVGPKQGGVGGFGIILVPAGMSLTRDGDPYAISDLSDASQDRLIAGQQIPPTLETSDFYYRSMASVE